MYMHFGILVYLSTSAVATTTLYNGAQNLTLSSALSNSCNVAFNTTLNCPQTIQLLPYPKQDVGWNTTGLTTLCTAACNSSITTLRNAVVAGCTRDSLLLSGYNITYDRVVDIYQYKYNAVCLTDPSSGNFCENIQNSWNITQMGSTATWPKYTSKTYYAPQLTGDWNPYVNENGTQIVPPMGNTFINASQVNVNGPPSAFDYFQNTPPPRDDTNFGWKQILGSDELPLQIQCSSCYINRFIQFYTSYWGNAWDEMSSQVWANMKQNCNLTTQFTPTHNVTFWNVTNGLPLTPTITPNFTACPQVLNITNVTDCQGISLQYQVPTSSIAAMNNFACAAVNGQVCAPSSCSTARVPIAQGVPQFVANYSNITLTQFFAWNPFADPGMLYTNEMVCVAPPGGVYKPPAATPANPTVYTTTANPAAPTVSGTIQNCGLYYKVAAGDYCNTVALNFTITLQQFLNMNCGLDANCDNLLTGYDYCVGSVNGTSVTTCPPRPSTSVASAAPTPVSAPGPTQSGTTSNCRLWYTVVSGDTCGKIENSYSITDAQFHNWNTGINSACSNLIVGDAYCVAGPSSSSTTTSSTTSTSTTVTPPAPTQSGTTNQCYKWYTVVSGDTCSKIENSYNITDAQFHSWNTGINSGCTNLYVGDAYCVSGPTSSAGSAQKDTHPKPSRADGRTSAIPRGITTGRPRAGSQRGL